MTDEMQAIRRFVKAWDALPRGTHPAQKIAEWLNSRELRDAVRELKDMVFVDDVMNMSEDELAATLEPGETMESVAAKGKSILERAVFIAWLADNGIHNVKINGDLYAGINHQLFTVAITVGKMFDKEATLGHYHYKSHEVAVLALATWQPSLTTDPEGFVAKKGF